MPQAVANAVHLYDQAQHQCQHRARSLPGLLVLSGLSFVLQNIAEFGPIHQGNGLKHHNMQHACLWVGVDVFQGPVLRLSYWHEGLTEGFLKCTILATARSGLRTGAYRSLQMAIRGRIKALEEPLAFLPAADSPAALSESSFSVPSLLAPPPLLPEWTSFSRAPMALLPSEPPALQDHH